MLERVSSAAAGLGASLLERGGQGVWLITPTPSKGKLRRMEAAGAGCAGVERGRPLGLPWGWCPPACRGAAPLGVGPSAYCPGERAIVGTWSAALIGSREISVWGSAHQPTAWPENLFCKVGRETEAQRGEGGAPKVTLLAGRADRRKPELGFCSLLTTQPLCVGVAPRLLEACEFAGAPRPRGGPYLSCERAEDACGPWN